MNTRRIQLVPIEPETGTIQELAHRAGQYFVQHPECYGVELHQPANDGTPTLVGFVRNPFMKTVTEDMYNVVTEYIRMTNKRTVEVRWKP